MLRDKWKKLDETRENLKFSLIKQYLDTITSILPHTTRSGSPVLNSSLAPYRNAMFIYARDHCFDLALTVILDLMDQLMADSGWKIVRPDDPSDAREASIICNSKFDPTLVTDSFTVLANLLEYGWSTHIMVSAGLDISKAKTQALYGSIMNIEQSVYEAVNSGTTELPLFSDELAQRFYTTVSNLTPPEIYKGSTHGFDYDTAKISLISRSILRACLCRVFGALILFHGSTTFKGLYQRVYKVYFTKSYQTPFDTSLRPEILSYYYYNPENPMEMFETVQRLMLTQKSNTLTDDIAAAYGNALLSWFIQGFGKLNTPRNLIFKTFASQLADHVRGRFPIMDRRDIHYQMLILKLAVLSEAYGKWWQEPSKLASKWLKYLHNHQARLSQRDGFTLSSEFCGHFAWFTAVYREKGGNKEQADALTKEANSFYTLLRSCMEKLSYDASTRTLLNILEFHAAYATLNPKVYFKDHFTELDTRPPVNTLAAILGVSNRIMSYDMGKENWVMGYSSFVLHAITFAGKKSLSPGPSQRIYTDTFMVGAVIIFRSGVYGIKFSSKSILEFCNMMIRTYKDHSTKNRELAVNSLVCLIKSSPMDSIDVIADTYRLLCDLLRSSEKVLQDIEYVHGKSCAWNLILVHDILAARVFITQKFLEMDPSRYMIDVKLESNLRTALSICITSTDRDITMQAIECTKQISQEISLWTEAQLPIDDFMKDSYHLRDFWALIIHFAPRDATNITHRLSMQKITILFYQKFTNPPITEWLLSLLNAGLGLWDRILNDTSGTLSAITRGTLINLMILITGISQCVRISSLPEHRNLVKTLAMRISQGLTSVHSLVRDSTVTTTRLTFIQNPKFALAIIEDVTTGWVIPHYKNTPKPKSMDIKEYRGISSLTSEVSGLYDTASDGRIRPTYDATELPTLLFAYCRYLYHKMPLSLSEPLFKINIQLAKSPQLLSASKFDTFEPIVNIIVDELHTHPNHKCIPLISETLAVLLDDYTLYSASNGTYSVFDKRYASFRSLVTTLAKYLEPGESSEVARNFETAIVRLCIANQDLAITFEESELVSNNRLRYCLYQCFTTILSEESDPNSQQQYDEIINLLLKDMVILEGMCEVCPQEDARDFTAHISTLFSEYGKVYELGTWAFERDLASAQSPDEVLRKNSINVWIVVQIFFAHLKPLYRQGVHSLIRKVYQDPYVFQKLADYNSEQCYDAVLVGKDLYRMCAEMPERCFGTPILKLVKFIQDRSNEKFPGYVDIIFRNLLLLRVTCPMIVQPQNFGIMSHSPEGIVRDGLIQLVKFMQKIDFKNNDSKGIMFAARELQLLRKAMVERSEVEVPVEFYNPMFSSDAINQSFYSTKQFLYRHSRELQAYLFIHAGASDKVTLPGDALNATSATMSNGVEKDVRLLEGFSQLLHKLGRPNMGLLDRSDRHRSSHAYTRKNSSVTWNYSDDDIFEINRVEDTTYLIVNIGSTAWPSTPSEHIFRNEFIGVLKKCSDLPKDHKLVGFADNTWGCLPVHMLLILRDQVLPATSSANTQFQKICHLNSSFAFFQAHIKTPFIVADNGGATENAFVTSFEFSPEELEVVGITESTVMVVRDAMKAEKFENIMLEYLGATYVFTVYIGSQYIHVVSSYDSCDVFTFDSIRFINGAIHLKKHVKAFSVDYTVKTVDAGVNAGFHKKLWNVLNNTRNNRNFFSPHPFMEVSTKQFQTYLLCHCLLDLSSCDEVARWHAHNLIPNVLAKFQSHNSRLDVPLQTLSWQPQRVTEISTNISKAHPELVFDVLQSFITITSHSGRLSRIAVDVFAPWFDMLPKAVEMDTMPQKSNAQGGHTRLHRLTRSLFSLNDTLYDTDTESAELLKSHLWPFMMDSPIAMHVIDVFMACNAFKIEALHESESKLTSGIAINTDTLRYLSNAVFAFIHDTTLNASDRVPRWSDNLAWCRIKVNLMTIAGCVFSGPGQIMEMLPDIIVLLFTFSAVGPLALRKSMHRLMNNVINQCAMSPRCNLSNQDQLRKLQSEINSNNGLLLFGVHIGTNDEEYDIFDGVQFADISKLGGYLMDLCSTILSPAELSSLRARILAQFYQQLPFGTAVFFRRIYMGILTFTNAKMTPKQLVHHTKFFMIRISQLPQLTAECRPRYIAMITQLYQIHCERLLIWLDDSSICRYMWSSMALQSMMVMPSLCDVVKNLSTCVRICQLRGLHSAEVTTMLAGPYCHKIKEWWAKYPGHLHAVPDPHKNFMTTISYPLIPLMRQVEARKTALEACEAWLALYENDTTGESTLELKLMYYVFASEERLVARANLFGVYADGIDEDELVNEIEQKLSDDLSADEAHGLSALISVCQVLDMEAVVTPSIRFFNMLVVMKNNKLILHLEPILSPLCANLMHLLEQDRPGIAIEISEAIAYIEGKKEYSYEESLKFVQQGLAAVGRPRDVDDSFVLHPPRTNDDDSFANSELMFLAADLVKNIIDTREYFLEKSHEEYNIEAFLDPPELD